MQNVLHVVDQPRKAAALLDPERRRLLEKLELPDSASGLARSLGTSRQIVSYHLRELEKAGLIELAEERRKGNCIERLMRRTARCYVIGSAALGPLGADPAAVADKLSSAYLIAVAARAIKEVSSLATAAEAADKVLPTLTTESEIRFRSAHERDVFVSELTTQIALLAKKYHDSRAHGGRTFRFLTAAYPMVDSPKGETK